MMRALESSRPLRLRPALACAALLYLSACANLGPFVWVDDYQEPPPPQDPGYLIRPGDLLYVHIWNQEQLSSRVRVREDGRISLMFLNDVEAAGYRPAILGQQLQTRLKDFINSPVVTVSLEETRPISVAVVGEVVRPGMLQLEEGSGLLQALAQAGGFTEYAHKDAIFVLRREPGRAAPVRVRFTYQALIHTEGHAPGFRLRAGDAVAVE